MNNHYSTENSRIKLKYMPHIDGIRAIAIILVLIFHSGLGILPSGFIGVDIFFVLSGFLITNQIATHIHNNSFSFSNFYLRRFRRLIPAYIVVVTATMIIGAFILLPEDLVEHSKIAALAFISLSNIYLANTTNGYFAQESDEIPLLHTWSLSVEEQYYVLWPILLFMLYSRFGQGRIITFLVILFFISIGLSEWLIQNNPEKSYYLLPTRFYELLTGGILALSFHRLPKLNSYYSALLAFISIFILGYSSFQNFNVFNFPGFNGIAICLATALLIYCGLFSNIITDFLGSKPLVGLGKISYSLYLWHWPIFAFTRYTYGELQLQHIIIGTSLAIALSLLTWKYVEIPFRNTKTYNFKSTLRYMYITPALILILLFLVIKNNDGFITRFGDKQIAIEALDEMSELYNESCNDIDSPHCENILLLGDSHAQHFGGFLHTLTTASENLALKIDMLPGCLPLVDLVHARKTHGEGQPIINTACSDRNQNIFNNLDSKNYKYIALAGFWVAHEINEDSIFYSYGNTSEFSMENNLISIKQSFIKTIEILLSNKIIPIVIKDNLTIDKTIHKCSIRKIVSSYDKHCSTPIGTLEKQQKSIDSIFVLLEERFPEIIFIDPNEVICNKTTCFTEINGIPLYYDNDHLNAQGSELIGRHYLKQLNLHL